VPRVRDSQPQRLSWACPPLQGIHRGRTVFRLHLWMPARDTTSLSFSGSPAYGNRSLEGRGCQPSSRAHPVHFHASGGPILSRTTSVALPSFFHPGNAPELSPFRALILPESRGPFPNPILPCRLVLRRRTARDIRLRRFSPSGNRRPACSCLQEPRDTMPSWSFLASLGHSLPLPSKPASRFLPLSPLA